MITDGNIGMDERIQVCEKGLMPNDLRARNFIINQLNTLKY